MRKYGLEGEGLWPPQEVWTEHEERLQQVLCGKYRDETGGLDLDGRREC